MQAHVQAGSEPEQGGAVEPKSEPAGRMSDEMLIWARGRDCVWQQPPSCIY